MYIAFLSRVLDKIVIWGGGERKLLIFFRMVDLGERPSRRMRLAKPAAPVTLRSGRSYQPLPPIHPPLILQEPSKPCVPRQPLRSSRVSFDP